MRTMIWTALVAPLALAASGSMPALAQPAQVFPFTCTIDLSQLTDADSQMIPERDTENKPLRDRSFTTPGEKRCTFSANQTTQITCETVVENWPDPPNVNIKTFKEPCEWFLTEGQCGIDLEVLAFNQTFTIERIDSTTAMLKLFCVGRGRPR